MGDFGEALGTVVEGGLYSRAVEPKAGEGSDGHAHEGACLNCGTQLVGPHCHVCGQGAHVHKTLGAFMHDLLHGAFHFEGKIWHTLPALAWKPGELTRRYIDGQRAHFVSPMALFLFSVFLMFAVFQIAGISAPDDLGPPVQMGDAKSAQEQAQQQLDGLREARDSMGRNSPATPLIEAQIERLEKQAGASAEASAEAGNVVSDVFAGQRDGAADAAAAGAGEARPNAAGEGTTGIRLIDHMIEKWRVNPELMAYKLQANSYKFSWLLIPLSIPFVWILFAWRRRFGAYDHAVFVTYSLAFMTLLYVTLVVLAALGVSSAILVPIGSLLPIYHIYRQLKGAYGLTRFSALWRTTLLCVFIFVILFLFVDLLLLLGALG